MAAVLEKTQDPVPEMLREKSQEGDVNVESGPVSSYDSDEPIDPNAQVGVQKIEAAANVWTKTTLILAFILIWIVYFVDALQQGTTGVLTVYVTSRFTKLGLTPTVNILSNIIGGVFKLTVAKILDVFGRPQGYMFSVIICTLGLIMMAATPNVETYAAAQVFYWVGFNGIGYSMTVALADMSSLRNRGLALAFGTSPYIITSWITAFVANAFYKPSTVEGQPATGPGVAWAFGAFSIITPAVCLPLFILFVYNYHKAKKLGYTVKQPNTRGFFEAIIYYGREFDVIGILLLSGGLALFLLPFNIYSFQTEGWSSAIVICFLVFGIVLMGLFVVWEKWFAPVQFIPYHLLKDRTVIGSCILACCAFIAYFIWDAFFFPFLLIVNNLDTQHAVYVTNIYNIGSCFWSFIVGIFIRQTGLFKPAVLFFGIPLTALGVGLMIHFREPNQSIGYIIMCQIFVAFGGGTTVVGQEVAIMSRVKHQHVAVVLAIQYMAASIGGAIGLSISAAIWQGVFPQRVHQYLPDELKVNSTLIAGDITKQLVYPVGSPARDALQQAYGDSQRYMLIAATCIFIIPLVAVSFWHNTDVRKTKQTKGLVF